MHTIAIIGLILSAVNTFTATETDTRNIAEGEKFELKCSTHLQYPIVWHFQQSDRTNEIFFGNRVSMAFRNMFFSTGNQSLGEYNLLIPSADARYAGNYKCIDDEGLGSELISIQINIIDREQFSTSVLIPTTPVASHSNDAADYEAPQEAASRSENSIQSISIAIPVVVCFIVLFMVIVIIIAVRKWRSKRARNEDKSCPEALHVPSSNPDSVETSERVRTSSDSSDASTTCEKLDDFANPPLATNHGESDVEKCNSNLLCPASCQPATRFRIDSDSSTSPLIHDGGERTS